MVHAPRVKLVGKNLDQKCAYHQISSCKMFSRCQIVCRSCPLLQFMYIYLFAVQFLGNSVCSRSPVSTKNTFHQNTKRFNC
jgi:hypothetical protein